MIKTLLSALLVALAAASNLSASEQAIVLPNAGQEPIGKHVQFLQEQAEALSIDAARQAFARGQFRASETAFLRFGIGARPVWLEFEVSNPTASATRKRLLLKNSWLDRIDVYFLEQDRLAASFHTGDSRPFSRRPVENRFFLFDHDFPPGTTTVFIRAETPDPLVLPIYLTSFAQFEHSQAWEHYSYGFLYGGIFVLLAYNLMLFFNLKSRRYLYYSLYLAAFLLMNLSYTGHAFMWLWPDSPRWQQWSNPLLMMLFAISGLVFALRFLEMKTAFPRLYHLVVSILSGFAALQVLAVIAGSQVASLLLSFFFIFVFSLGMVLLGALSLYVGNKSAKYFLLASVTHATAASITAMVVWGIVPYSTLAYRAIDIGMMLDAILLAMALADQFRINREEKIQAEKLALIDPLTEINNRRAFYEFVNPIWSTGLRHGHDMAIILLDIDCFKRVNDTFGHKQGDKVLTTIATIMREEKRAGDILARWGGEEFILFLPETSLDEALAIAERLRQKIMNLEMQIEGKPIPLTVSLGVAHMDRPDTSLDELISTADKQLYQAKEGGRNRVC